MRVPQNRIGSKTAYPHDVERQEPAEVRLLLDVGHKMPAGSLTRPCEIFFKKCGGCIDKPNLFVYI